MLPSGWLYLPDAGPFALDTPCLFLPDSDVEELNERGVPRAAADHGYPVEGLDSDSIGQVVAWAQQLMNPPSDALLLESFAYYLKFDAFLPYVGAPDPPPWKETERAIDREFYESLGSERPGVRCRDQGCSRGAVALSAFCRVHHFEMIRKKPCPFAD
jgi:hypothetical protein